MQLAENQIDRYNRHILLKEVGGKGQEKLLNAKVLIIGVGGLGAPAAFYLASAGIGTLGIVDGDKVELSNLQRQIIHFTPDIYRTKVSSAEEKIKKLNPDVHVITYNERVTAHNISDIINHRDYDFIIEGTDNFPAKFLINDASFLLNKAYSHGGILKFQGQTLTYVPGTACYRCIFHSPPPKGVVPSCSEAGVLGAIAGTLGTIQATEALKYVLGTGKLITNRILHFNALEMEFRSIPVTKNPECPVCGKEPEISELKDYMQPECDLRQRSVKE